MGLLLRCLPFLRGPTLILAGPSSWGMAWPPERCSETGPIAQLPVHLPGTDQSDFQEGFGGVGRGWSVGGVVTGSSGARGV